MDNDDDNGQIQLREIGHSSGSLGNSQLQSMRSRHSIRDKRGFSMREQRSSGKLSSSFIDSTEGKTPRFREATGARKKTPN